MRRRLGLLCLLAAISLALFSNRGPVDAYPRPAPAGYAPGLELAVPPFEDKDVQTHLADFDRAIAHASTASVAQRSDDVSDALSTLTHQLQEGELSTEQETSVLGRLDQFASAHPRDRSIVQVARHVVSNLTVGKVAPDIAGQDLDGSPMRLSDYRGKVVLLAFSGEWCGICRSEYPYERLLLELYRNWPFAIVGVNSDSSPDVARQAYAAQGLVFRSWYDGDPNGDPKGPIATEWNVSGWPTTYLLDEKGVIRFINLKQEDLLKGVRQLLTDQAAQRGKRAAVSAR
jgi:peroxiredoxin